MAFNISQQIHVVALYWFVQDDCYVIQHISTHTRCRFILVCTRRLRCHLTYLNTHTLSLYTGLYQTTAMSFNISQHIHVVALYWFVPDDCYVIQHISTSTRCRFIPGCTRRLLCHSTYLNTYTLSLYTGLY